VAQGEHPDPFCWDGAVDAARPPAAVVLAPRRRIGPRVALAAVVVAGGVAAALLAGVFSGGGGTSAGQRSVLATVADVTTHVPGFRFTLAVNATGGGQNIAFNASGELNTAPLNGSISADVAGKQFNELLVAPYVYVQIPSLGGGWERIALGANGSSQAVSGADVEQTIGFLRSVGTVSTVGTETIDRVQTTHYHAVIDVDRLASALPLSSGSTDAAGLSALSHALGGSGLPLDVWVDAQDRVRQLTMSMPLNTGSSSLQFSMTMKLSDYGPQAVVAAPPGQVTDLGSAAPALAG